MLGVHKGAVRKAIAMGRITTEADGTIDAASADAMWDASTDPTARARDLGRGTAAATRTVAGTKAVPRQALAAVAQTLTQTEANSGWTGLLAQLPFDLPMHNVLSGTNRVKAR